VVWLFLLRPAIVSLIPLDIYLIQHGESKSKEQDPARSLTEDGRKTVELVAARLAELGIRFDRVVHSGKLRSQQTAEILAGRMKSDEVSARTGLDPLDEVQPTARWLSEQAHEGLGSVAIVGHLPFLDKLASSLVAGNENAGVIAFQYGGVVKLSPKTENEGYRIRWILAPELITH
jgi:phosphohistidine phosphatase